MDGTGVNGLPPSLNTPLVTLYSYDPLDNLTLVQQGVQQRRFIYDGLGRLTGQTTPEGGTVNFTYTDFSAVATRTDARGVITSYAYDGLNRLTQVSYNVGASGVPATPGVTFSYDAGGAAANALGRLTSMTDGVGGEGYQYDALGRVTALTKTISGASYPLSYQYNLASALTSITYPSGRVVQQSFDPIGRLSQITSAGTNYLSNIAYNAAFEPTAMTYGNGVQGSMGYNARLQLATLAYSSGATTLFSLAYNYGTGNNGQIQSISDNMDGTRTTTYTYDAWARLKMASNTQWTVTETYDRYGNRKSQSAPVFNSVTVDPSTNRFLDPAYSYDAAGNMTADGLNTLTYDAENHIVSNTQVGATSSYTYDGNSLRVKKISGGTTTVYIFSGTKVLAEYVNGAAPAAPTREYIYSGSALLAKIEGGTTQYFHQDHLSNRVVTDSTGTVVEQKGHYPFGEAWYEGATPNKLKFTSYERDTESGNDYALARFYVNRLGRFSSPDPIAGSVADPQSLNRYAYVRNDPVNMVDLNGLTFLGTATQLSHVTLYFSVTVYARIDPTWSGLWSSLTGGHVGKRPQDDPHGPIGRGFGDGLLARVVGQVCSTIPEGRTSSLSGTVGFLQGHTGSAGELINYNTGQRSLFVAGGNFAGLNSIATGSVNGGFVYNLGTNNSNYAGGFNNYYASVAIKRPFAVQGYYSSSTSNNVREGGAGLGASLVPRLPIEGGVSHTNFTVVPAGTVVDSHAGPASIAATLLDSALIALRAVCNAAKQQ